MNDEALMALAAGTTLHNLMLAKIARKMLTREECQEIADAWEITMKVIVKNKAEEIEKAQVDPTVQLLSMCGLGDMPDAETVYVAGKKMIDNGRPLVLNILNLD